MVDPSTNTGTTQEAATTTSSTTQHGGSTGRGGGRGRSGGRGYRNHSKTSTTGNNSSQMIDSLREACPAHKQNQLADLIKELNGDEEKIRQKISEWWDEPVTPSEGDWEDVNKRSSQSKNAAMSKSNSKSGAGRGRGTDSGRGRGASRGSGREGRGREGRGRGRSERGAVNQSKGTKPTADEVLSSVTNPEDPIPVVQPSLVASNDVENISPSKVEPTMPEIAPAPVAPEVKIPTPVVPTFSTTKGNVWATRGSAHLIKAEKPVPPKPIVPPAPVSRQAKNGSSSNGDCTRATPSLNLDVPVVPEKTTAVPPTSSIPPVSSIVPEPIQVAPPTPLSSLTSGIPSVPSSLTSSSLNATSLTASKLTTSNTPAINAWNQDTASDPVMPSIIPAAQPPKPTPVLNMGRWETAETDDDLDFGFGFDTSTADISDTHIDSKSNNVTTAAVTATTAASPARPPPGLSMSGMPPMPANAVLVHELEDKLDEVSISKPQQQQVQENPSSLSGFAPTHHPPFGGPPMPESSLSSQPLYGSNPYSTGAGGVNMYGSYNNPGIGGSGGSAIPNHTFIPSGNLGIPQPSKAPLQQQGQQQNLYTAAASSGNAPTISVASGGGTGVGGSNDATTSNLPTNATTASTMPPGMPGGMPYGNPMYYGHGQQPFVMGQHQPNIGYSYGYGNQFAGGVQNQFGYPGGMHGSSGYGHGGPSYDDHTGVGGSGGHGNIPGSGSVGGLGGYDPQQQPKNSGGYRGSGGGRHNSNQYQQYNPQQQHHQLGGYGAQPYGMGYHGDHFNQRGGYQNMQDHYGMQQQQQGVSSNYGGFQGDSQYKGKKNNRGGLNQFQQQGQPVINQTQHVSGQQQPFSLQGQVGGVSDTNQPGTDGWSNQNVGWSGGASSGWQAK